MIESNGSTSQRAQTPLALDERLEHALAQQQQSWQRGQPVSIEALASDCAGGPDDFLELIYHEAILREQAGEHPSLAEYQERFPQLSHALRLQWEIDRALSEHLPLDGASFDRYVIRDEIARGSLGIVYEAWDPRLKRIVALKKLRAGFDASSDEVARLKTEAEAIARVRHPCVVEIYDVGESHGQPFFAMEYCAGSSLAKRLGGTPLAPHDAARLVEQVARGVAAAHAHGIVHRDLKPSNILLAAPGEWSPKITDFGLAKWLNVDRGLTTTGAIVGTPAYMAPEQARGAVTQIGPAADIYAIGAVLYECLTGRPPFQSSSITETLEQVRSREPVAVRQLQPHVPSDVETIAHKCLQKDVSQRYLSAQAVADDLNRYLQGQPILARPLSSNERVWRWCRRNPRMAALVGSIALLLVVIAVGSSTAAFWLKKERDTAREAESKAVASEKKHLQELYHAYLLEARASRMTEAEGRRERGLDAIRNILVALPLESLTPKQRAELRDEALASLALADVRRMQKLPKWCRSSTFFDVAIDSRFETFAAADATGRGVVVGNCAAEKPLTISPLEKTDVPWIIYRRFSPDGSKLVSLHLRLIDAQQNESRMLIRIWDRATNSWLSHELGKTSAQRIAFHPQRAEFALPCADSVIRVYDLETCAELRRSPGRFPMTALAYSPDGKRFAVARINQPSEIIDAETWETLENIPQTGPASAAVWTPSGKQVFFGNREGKTYCWNIEARVGLFFTNQHQGPIDEMLISPDGELLATSCADDLLHVRRIRGDQFVCSLRGRAVGFASDSERLAVATDDRIEICKVTGRDAYRIVRVPTEGVAYSPNGRWLAAGGADCARIYAASDLRELAILGVDLSGPVSFHPNSDALVTFGIFSHVWKWPITEQTPEHARRQWKVGPAERVPLPTSLLKVGVQPQHLGRHATWSQDGRLFVVGDNREGRVLVSDDAGQPPKEFAKLMSVTSVAVSPDNAWIAAGSKTHARVCVWSAKDARLSFDLPGFSHVAFSSDGQSFAAGAEGHIHLYRTGSWKLERSFERPHDVIQSPVTFQPGGSLLAYAVGPGKICLYDTQAARVAATLTDPEARRITCLTFSPDGSRLALAGNGWDVCIWDLDRLRQGLVELGLPAEGLPERAEPLPTNNDAFTVEWGRKMPPPEQWAKNWILLANWELLQGTLGDAVSNVSMGLQTLRLGATPREKAELLALRGNLYELGNTLEAARDDWEAALALDPNRPQTAVRLARLSLLGPARFREARRAVSLLAPLAADDEIQFLLAVAELRQGHATSARAALEPMMSDSPLVAVYAAIALQQTGEVERARQTLQAARERFGAQRHPSPVEPREFDEAVKEALIALGSSAAP